MVALAADIDHRGAMQQAIQGGRCHDRVVGEHLPPSLKALAERVEEFLARQAAKRIAESLGIPGAFISPLSMAGRLAGSFGLFIYSTPTAQCQTLACDVDQDGLDDIRFAQSQCSPGMN